MPSQELIRKAWESNSDGAGVAWFSGKFAHFQKGFMKLKELESFLNEKDFGLHDRVCIHFRIGTSGGKTPQNCHPFPMTDNEIDLVKTSGRVLGLAFHNGICGQGEASLSDTAVLVRDILSGLSPFLRDSSARRAVENLLETKGKFLLWSRGELYKMGDWKQKEGLWLSNLNHERAVYDRAGLWGKSKGKAKNYWEWDKELSVASQRCTKCGAESDPKEQECPKCEEKRFSMIYRASEKKEAPVAKSSPLYTPVVESSPCPGCGSEAFNGDFCRLCGYYENIGTWSMYGGGF